MHDVRDMQISRGLCIADITKVFKYSLQAKYSVRGRYIKILYRLLNNAACLSAILIEVILTYVYLQRTTYSYIDKEQSTVHEFTYIYSTGFK